MSEPKTSAEHGVKVLLDEIDLGEMPQSVVAQIQELMLEFALENYKDQQLFADPLESGGFKIYTHNSYLESDGPEWGLDTILWECHKSLEDMHSAGEASELCRDRLELSAYLRIMADRMDAKSLAELEGASPT